MKFFSKEVFTLKYCFGRFCDEKISGCIKEKEVICIWSTAQSFQRTKQKIFFMNPAINAELVDDAFIKH